MKWMCCVSMAIAMAVSGGGCGAGDDDDEGGFNIVPWGACQVMVNDRAECPSAATVCRPDVCAAYSCCFGQTEGGYKAVSYECQLGCGNDVDAAGLAVDGPPSDGCRPDDAARASALPHC